MDSGSVVFDRYRLEERIGAGGMGVVWRATDLLLDQPVALKWISLAGVDDEQAELTRQRALREARLAARLRHHRHVVATYDVRIDNGDVWLMMEHVPCHSLAQSLRERGPLDVARVARIGAQVADALATAHALGIEHRDVTPGNVLVTDDGAAKLTDFGISRLAGGTQLTQTGTISGTFPYLAPEVVKTGKSSTASDMFSLGATLYAAIEGQPPFGIADNPLQMISIVGVGVIRPPIAAGAFTPLLLRLLELDPNTRPDAATARDMLDEFATQMSAVPTHHAPTHDPPTPSQTPRRRWWLPRHPVLIAVIVLAALVGLGVMLATIGDRDDDPAVAALPSTVGPIALTGDPRAADPCALIDLAPLRRFGVPFITFTPDLGGCQARVGTPAGDIRLDVDFDTPVVLVADLHGTRQQLGDLTIVDEGIRPGEFLPSCQNVIVLADRTRIEIDAYGPAPDVCAVAETGTVTAVNQLARHGISYRPDRTASSLIAHGDACTALDDAALSKMPGLDPSIRHPGFANWSCTWGASGKGRTKVSLKFRLNDAAANLGHRTTIAGRRAWLHIFPGANNPHQCAANVVYRPAPTATTATETIEVTVDTSANANDLCTEATELATAAVAG